MQRNAPAKCRQHSIRYSTANTAAVYTLQHCNNSALYAIQHCTYCSSVHFSTAALYTLQHCTHCNTTHCSTGHTAALYTMQHCMQYSTTVHNYCSTVGTAGLYAIQHCMQWIYWFFSTLNWAIVLGLGRYRIISKYCFYLFISSLDRNTCS